MRATALEIVEELQLGSPLFSARQFYLTRIRDTIAPFYMAATFSRVSSSSIIKGFFVLVLNMTFFVKIVKVLEL